MSLSKKQAALRREAAKRGEIIQTIQRVIVRSLVLIVSPLASPSPNQMR